MRIAVITGGAGGIGLACAEKLGRSFKLLLADISHQKLDEAAAFLQEKGFAVETAICDVSDCDSVRALAQKAASLGEIGPVLHIAGVGTNSPADVIVKVNGLGTYYMINEFFEVMGEGSNMLTISSLSSHIMSAMLDEDRVDDLDMASGPEDIFSILYDAVMEFAEMAETEPGGIAYAFAKFFSWRYTLRNVRRYGTKGIRINTATPGTIATQMGSTDDEECRTMQIGMAIQRYGTPEECAAGICFLTSDAASDITGVELPIDGGYLGIMKFPQIKA